MTSLVKLSVPWIVAVSLLGCSNSEKSSGLPVYYELSRTELQNKLEGFWLGQSIANWTGLVTEMDKIGGDGPHGEFYTRDSWGQPDQPSIWGQGIPSELSANIDWVFEDANHQWGADDDTDIEYIYLQATFESSSVKLSPQQIRNAWLTHIYSDADTPFTTADGQPENYLWVSNQQAFDLMLQQGMLPPETSAPKHNPHYDMIDAQLTTEIFGLMAPGAPAVALELAELPIATTARENAAWAAQFYVVMHALAFVVPEQLSRKEQIFWLAEHASQQLPSGSYVADMHEFVKAQYVQGLPWEQTRDALYQRYQVEQAAGYDLTSRGLYCNGCFAAGINFGASLISLFYGEGDYRETVKLAALMGWDSDNPAATWGGLIGFLEGRDGLEAAFGREFSSEFNIHRTRKGFANDGIDTFENMALRGVSIVERAIEEYNLGEAQGDVLLIKSKWLETKP